MNPELDKMIDETAEAIAGQAGALADGTLVGPRRAAAIRILENAKTLLAFIDHAEKKEAAI